MKIFFDTEFTALNKDCELLSIGLISEDNKMFYAEINDFDEKKTTPWVKQYVVPNLIFYGKTYTEYIKKDDDYVKMLGSTKYIADELRHWLEQFDEIEMWGDCLCYDWTLFIDLFGSAFDIPKNVYHIPFDLCTQFKMNGIDPDISREDFLGEHNNDKHNALFDAEVIKMCHEKMEAGVAEMLAMMNDEKAYRHPKLNILDYARERIGNEFTVSGTGDLAMRHKNIIGKVCTLEKISKGGMAVVSVEGIKGTHSIPPRNLIHYK